MKLPYNFILSPILKPHFGITRQFCQHPTFSFSLLYTYFYSILGLYINVKHLIKHLGKIPYSMEENDNVSDLMLVHDLKIIATSLGLFQYICLLVGCFTENSALFLPHLAGQLIVVNVKLLNTLLLLFRINMKTFFKLQHRLASIILMTFNWFQEFCVFRQFLCICDL